MSTARKLFFSGIVLVALGGAALSWRATRAAHALDSQTETQRGEIAAFETEARQLQDKIAEAQRRLSEREAARPIETARKSNVATMAKPKPASPPPPNDPQRQAAQLKSFHTRLALEYLAFYRARGLSDVDVARLEDLLTEHEAARLDLLAVAREKSLALNDSAVTTLRQQENERHGAELAKLLGAEGAKKFEDYQAASPARNAVGKLVANLALTAEPMSSAQANQLATLFQEQGFRDRRTDAAMWDAVLERSANFLTARQRSELRATAEATLSENAFQKLTNFIARAKK